MENGFKKAVLGLSGGIDSALVAAIACDAIGSENVLGIMMPSRYSSESSVKDSIILADNLGMKTVNIPIEEPFKAFNELLEPYFEGRKTDSTEENIQARIKIKTMPEIKFIYDTSIDNGIRINKIIEDLKKKEKSG